MTKWEWGDERESPPTEDDMKAKDEFVAAVEESVGHKLSLDERLKSEEVWDMMAGAGRAISEIETEPDRLCKFCGCPVDDGLEHEWRKGFPTGKEGEEMAVPKTLTSRMAHGFQRDKDGEWMHLNVWQCLLSWQWHNVPLRLPDDPDN